ncbi:MAG: hemolysin III family protein [Bacteriovorax sp.]|nr:hemolysin III family protein [Bacteriovorax sp.]
MSTADTKLVKPYLRGHSHQAAFFFALGACMMMISKTHSLTTLISLLIYSLSLCGLFGISALYHRPTWTSQKRQWMKRLDHAAIYVLIAGTGTPLFYLALPLESGVTLLMITWTVAVFGILQSLFWVNAPKWISSIFYVAAGYLVVPYFKELHAALGTHGIEMLLIGGFFYTVGAVIYAVKRPNPWPKTFGYHEIFHLLVIMGAAFHFIVINNLIRF